ncbi:MAG: hypothetical protein BMS9Abin05_2252 [Rhodothermia bacterium]|nr:MAG: hypothetical protein BMS9Abin05_2252 [Rhodothermia bacterium]
MRSRFDRGAYRGVGVLFLTTRKYSLNYSTFLGLLIVLILFPERASAQRTEPRGSFLQVGPSALGGYGVYVGYINAKDFFTREVLVLGDVRAALDPGHGSNQIVLMIGGALRVFGIERTVGNVPYRGFDTDLGFRIGPGLSFSTRETRATKNQRFNLFLEPYARFSFGIGLLNAAFLEVGTTRPHLRAGVWLRL